ncbi:hypothetical protein H2200_007762 [Cladophialophora chaetospira]|uniref:FAM192A/Fyv6 N-terminal domain-containing protein n=1 Tax=Cladophialophora chaetospira TaxID=386627 RepID=A0AA38X6J1_9EURO|nr:hypothetical protein H2200_007762 [Cladophialophora chaetospira]
MSRFVSAGTDGDSRPPVDEDWLKAQQEVESARKAKKVEKQEGGKSLYEVLEANKAAKQEAFEEAARLKNQFRALDEDEVDFLDSVLESSRAKENAVRQETAEQLEAFRKQRAAAEQAMMDGPDPGADVATSDAAAWATKKKKRRRDKDTEAGADPKLRKLSTPGEEKAATQSPEPTSPSSSVPPPPPPQRNDNNVKPPLTQKSSGLGLAAYSSDEDD